MDDQRVKKSVNALVEQGRQGADLKPVEPIGGYPSRRGMAHHKAAGGGVSSPLTEQDFSTREYHTAGILSSDGLFTLPAVKTIHMEDAQGESAVFIYASPQDDPEEEPSE